MTLLADVAATPDLVTAIVGVLGGGGFAGLVGWVLKIGLPNVTGQFGKFVSEQLAAAAADREAAKQERADLLKSHNEQIARLMATNAEQMGRVSVALDGLTSTVADMAAEMRAVRAIIGDHPDLPAPPPPVAPPPREAGASGRHKKLPPGTTGG